jgi:sulfite exporter TauE/SafE
MDLLAALTLGIIGSLHCVGMCGPLVLAIPTNATSQWEFILERLLFSVGKAVTYGIMGAFLGLAGKSILMNFQQNVSIVLGITILLTVAIPIGFKSRFEKFSPLKYVHNFVRDKFSMLIRKRGRIALFSMGSLNGLLPCGLVYTALIGATAVADVWHSALFMIVFGLGTAPALIAVAIAGKLFSMKYRSLLSKTIPVMSIVLAVILILRGMNLGIPLLSPKITHTAQHQEKMDCCEE